MNSGYDPSLTNTGPHLQKLEKEGMVERKCPLFELWRAQGGKEIKSIAPERSVKRESIAKRDFTGFLRESGEGVTKGQKKARPPRNRK